MEHRRVAYGGGVELGVTAAAPAEERTVERDHNPEPSPTVATKYMWLLIWMNFS